MENPYTVKVRTWNNEILHSAQEFSISFPMRSVMKFLQKNAKQSTKVKVN